ncbi:unnamed protein product [Mytilus edulis]|uniref:Endonuclease/exonuclease/phosphatase domain-containing protein n=1 Tax=Mytilus edulis TaxID=6550 RepID=A0A8S3RQX8_MYTED|nr:unnamed protein product [Mytilus edulis]
MKKIAYHIDQAEKVIDELEESYNPDVIAYHILSNELTKKSSSECVLQLEKLIQKTKEKRPDSKIVVSLATNRSDERKYNLKVNTVNSLVKEMHEESSDFVICDNHNLSVSGEINKKFINNDGYHLSDVGVKVLAANIRKCVDQILGIPFIKRRGPVNQGDQFECLINDITNMYDKGDIALFGDFNARVAVDVDFIPNDNCSKFMPDEHYIEDVPCTTRESQDQVRCNRGKSLIDLCIQSRLRILNGRTLGDFSGKFTAHCSLGSSVIDYIIGSESISHRFLCMKVHDFQRSISNHCLLSCILSVDFDEQLNSETTKLFPLPPKI